MSQRPRQIHLAAHFPGVNNTTVWAHPDAQSQVEFSSFEHLARTAERGKFDFFFLAEGLRLREVKGRIHDLDVVGRPDNFGVLAGLAAVTTHLGLGATASTTYHEPYELARQVSTLDHLSEGRAAWNVVTSPDEFTGANFRRGGFLDRSLRYTRATEFVMTARELWDSWFDDDVVADAELGDFVRRLDVGRFAHHGEQFDITGHFNLPRSPQGHPVVIQAGDSDEGRELAAATADVLFTGNAAFEAGRAFFADVKGRMAAYGRSPDELKILPAATVVLGDTAAEAVERSAEIRRQQVSAQTAIQLIELIWNRDLSDVDPDGPLPADDPDLDGPSIVQGRVRPVDPMKAANDLRAIAAAKNLSLHQVVIERAQRHTFVGTPEHVAGEIDRHVQLEASDGFILVPHLTPSGLDEFVDRVVPLLQERGAFRSEYTETTLRGHLGLLPRVPNPSGR